MMENKFLEASRRERFSFKMLCDQYQLFKVGYDVYLSPEDSYDKYDSLIQKFDKGSYVASKRFIVEFKVRNVQNEVLIDCQKEGWILEKKKFDSLMKVCNLDRQKNEVLYISFVNNKTLIWNLSILHKKGLLNLTSKEMNKATMNNRRDKVNKTIYLLKEEWAKSYNYIFDEESYQSHLDEEKELKKIRKADTKSMAITINSILGL